MAKRNSKKQPKAKKAEPDQPAREIEFGEFLARSANVGAVALVIALAGGWAMAEGPLRDRVAEQHADPIRVAFDWPLTSPGKTWVPESVQRDLAQVALATISMDPFDQLSLELAREKLIATGWLEDISALRRRPGGLIEIEGIWRAPTALVRYRGEDYLVGPGGEPLKRPEGSETEDGAMYVIADPATPPPRGEHGGVLFGVPWRNAEIQPAIELLRRIAGVPGAERIVGVALDSYLETGHLVLVTDTGARVTWGSPIGQLAPGQVDDERRLRRLSTVLTQRLDANRTEVEIHLPRGVMVDRTTQSDG